MKTAAAIAFLGVSGTALVLAVKIAERKTMTSTNGSKNPVADTGTPQPPEGMTADKASLLAQGIAVAEGFGVPGAIPTRAHNPGDQAIGDKYGLGVLGPSSVTVFPNDGEGWLYLVNTVTRWLAGKSNVYFTSDSFREVARKYVNGPLAQENSDSLGWARNAVRTIQDQSGLPVTVETTLREFSEA